MSLPTASRALVVAHLIVRKWGVAAGAAVVAVVSAILGAQPPVAAAAASKPKIVYLTFDDGPNAINSPRLLKLLAKEQVPATFFVVGQFLAADPDYATRLWLRGHAVGNHTWSHADLTHLGAEQIRHQLISTQRLLGRAGGKCMRPPYGAMNPVVSAFSSGLGLTPVLWTVDPQDWAHQDAGYITGRVLTHVRNRSIVLLHDGGGPRSATIAAVRQIIPRLRLQGYEFRTVPACRVEPLSGSLRGAAVSIDRPRQEPTPTPTPSAPTQIPSTPTGQPPTQPVATGGMAQ